NSPMDQNEFMKRMKAIASDLWGGVMPVATETPAAAPAQPKPAAKETEKPGTEIRNLWKTADESIDWTDALSHSTPADGLTTLKMWSFYHKHADRVLAGDLDAYTEVLQKANPLGELTDYAENISMRAVSAAKLESTFICKAESMEKNRKLYLSAMGLRIARDLLACLPVEEVTVKGEYAGETVFTATYPRLQLLHRNFMFVDPVELSVECGAKFTGI
ncbi:MAG: hypothetical protein J6Y48_12845, partial [Clostridia bacterium]|nr:hypothetical protein [Clostridia bacterium]